MGLLIGASMNETDLPNFKTMLVGNNIMRIFPKDTTVATGKVLKVIPPWTDARFKYCQDNNVIPFVSTKVDGDSDGLAFVKNQLINMPAWITTLYITDRHEPEGDSGSNAAATYKTNFKAFYEMLATLSPTLRAKIKCGPVLTKTWTEKSGGGNNDYSIYDPMSIGVGGDFFAVDMYVETGTASAVVTPATMPTPDAFTLHFRNYKYNAQDTRPRMWPEWGLIGMPADTDGTARANWITAIHNLTKTWKVGQSGWTQPWSFIGWIWWHSVGKATGQVKDVGQARDFPLHLRSVPDPSKTTVVDGKTQWISNPVTLPGNPPAPVAAFNAAFTSENTTVAQPISTTIGTAGGTGAAQRLGNTGGTPVTTTGWILGATMKKEDIAAWEPRLSSNKIFRIFPNSNGLPPAWDDPRFAYAQRVGAIPFVSSNIDGDTTKFAALRQWIIDMPAWVKTLYITDRHEPENNFPDATVYKNNFTAWWNAVIATLPSTGTNSTRSRVRAGHLLSRQWAEKDATRSYATYDTGMGDFFGTDHYFNSWGSPSTTVATSYGTAADFVAKFAAYKFNNSAADTRDRIWGEWGAIGIPADPTGEQRAKWMKDVAAILDTWSPATVGWRFIGAIWWNNQGTTSPTSLTGSPGIGTLRYFYLDSYQNAVDKPPVAYSTTPAPPLAAYNQLALAHQSLDTSTGGGSSTTVSAGGPATIPTTATFTRTASEPAGSTVTARKWEIVSGPMGTGTTIGTTAALSWKPGTSVAGNDIRQPTIQELAYRLTSIAENATLDWTTAYGYIEDIGDNRGYTGGLVGFTSGTGDMLQLVQQYAVEKPGNALAVFIPKLQECATIGFGAGASAAAASKLGAPFIAAWKSAAANDPVFRKVQRDFRKSMYWDDALVQALADGVGPLGLAIYYDVLVNHGVGTDSESFGGILAFVRAANTKPSAGGNQTTWLNAITDRRNTILVGWGDTQQAVNGRVFMHRLLINGGTVDGVAQAANLNLVPPFKVSCYGDTYTIAARPEPAADSLLGKYVLRYTATGAGTSDVTVNVSDSEPSTGNGDGGTTDPGTGTGGGDGGGGTTPPVDPNPTPDNPGTGGGGTVPGDASNLPADLPPSARLMAAEYVVLITDRNLNVLGDPIATWITLDITLRFNEPGSGQFTAPGYSWTRDQLIAGARVVVIRRVLGSAKVVLAGPIEETNYERSDDGENGGAGKLTVSWVEDSMWLGGRLTYPEPTKTPQTQAKDFWTWSGNAELGMLSLVNLNAGIGAQAVRQVPRLIVAAAKGVGGSVTVSATLGQARFIPVSDCLRDMATRGGGLGFRTYQTMSAKQIVFEVFKPRDLSKLVRFGFNLGNLKYLNYIQEIPEVTAVIVGGQYNKDDVAAGADKFVTERRVPGTESTWGRIERYLPRPGNDPVADLLEEADRELTGDTSTPDDVNVPTPVSTSRARLASTAADTPDQRYGVHYDIGDIVSIEIWTGQALTGAINTVHIQAWPTAGEVVNTTIGDHSETTNYARVKQLRAIDRRVAYLERNATVQKSITT